MTKVPSSRHAVRCPTLTSQIFLTNMSFLTLTVISQSTWSFCNSVSYYGEVCLRDGKYILKFFIIIIIIILKINFKK